MISPFPGRRDLVLLAAGLVLGVVLGPPVLGSLAPAAYLGLFGGTDAAATLREVNAQAAAARAQAREQLGLEPDFQPAPPPPAGEAADVEADPARARAQAQYRQVDEVLARTQLARARAVDGAMDAQAVRWLLALLVALAGVFVAEVLAAPEAPTRQRGGSGSVVVSPALRRLVTVRYALLSMALAVLLARASLYEMIPWPFVIVLLGVALAAAWVPLGRKASASGSPSSASGPGEGSAPASINPAASTADETIG